ncbi:MAG: hypothetical protein QOE27_1867 [Solirubrobacteraceae bacterium]|jgi:hypothetical protein|nr:hypothetical protein [Solirubrobacteraceae bacterium]MEA2355387.1 hypothetical protein [Solirubrobacteraceae bacterium]
MEPGRVAGPVPGVAAGRGFGQVRGRGRGAPTRAPVLRA